VLFESQKLPAGHGAEGSTQPTQVFVAGSQTPPSGQSQPAASPPGPPSGFPEPPVPVAFPVLAAKPPYWGKPHEAKTATTIATSATDTTRKGLDIRRE
jgi:hypothetical protein